MIAGLPMYLRAEVEDAHQHYWQLIRTELLARDVACPEALSVAPDLAEMWLSPGLVLSQTCGMPYRLQLQGKVKLVGTPDYGLEGCAPGYYRSAIIVRQDDSRNHIEEFANAVFAFNQEHSQSGFAAAFAHCKEHGFWFSKTIATGGHAASADAVIQGRADIAAVDAVTWNLLSEYEPAMKMLRVLDWTIPTPGLPYITAISNDEDRIFDAVKTAIDNLDENNRSLLQLKGIVKIDESAYLAVPNPDV